MTRGPTTTGTTWWNGMAEAEAEGEADRLPHGRCIWAHMRYARLGEGDGDGM